MLRPFPITSLFFKLISIALIAAAGSSMRADDGVFAVNSEPKLLWKGGEFTEGVAARSDGLVFFSDIPSDPATPGRILVFNPATRQTQVFCANSSKSNGLAFDSGDRMLACCGANGGLRALCEVTEDGLVRGVSELFEKKPFNSPNDLAIHRDGSVYFSDPRYVGFEPLALPGMWVFRFDPETGATTVATKCASKPNGIGISPDGKTIYVANTDNGSVGLPDKPAELKKRMTLEAFDIATDGTLTHRMTLVDFGGEDGIDGMTVDASGRIFAAVRSEKRFGIAVFNPSGYELAFLKTPTLPSNCSLGVGNDAETLYITAGGELYCVKVKQ
ncbi:MAG: SMP-30/gluconolactonase/LRE family protein [Planctomycetaceae bacterium]